MSDFTALQKELLVRSMAHKLGLVAVERTKGKEMDLRTATLIIELMARNAAFIEALEKTKQEEVIRDE